MTIQNLTRSVSTINEATAQELGKIVVKARLAKGYNPYTPDDQKKAVAAWIEILSFAGVPADAYNICYLKAQEMRSQQKADGRKPDDLDATLLVAVWIASVRSEYYEHLARRTAGRQLTDGSVKKEDCQKCFSSGFETVIIDGYKTAKKCDHIPNPETEVETEAEAEEIEF